MKYGFNKELCASLAYIIPVCSWLLLFSSELWLDELGSWGLSRGSSFEIIEKTSFRQGQGALYFLLLGQWTSWFGDSAWVIRFLSLLLTLGSIYFVHTTAKKLTPETAYVYVFLYASSPWISHLSLLGRPYCLANFLIGAFWLIMVAAKDYDNMKNKTIFSLLSFGIGLALFHTHYLYVLTSLVGAFFFYVFFRPLFSLQFFLVHVGGVFFGGLLISSSFVKNASSLSHALFYPDVYRDALFSLVFFSAPTLAYFILPTIYLVGRVLTKYPWRKNEKETSVIHGLISLIGASSLLIMTYVSSFPFILPRYFSIIVLPITFFCGTWIASLSSKFLSQIIFFCFVMIQGIFTGYESYHFYTFSNPWRELVYEINKIPGAVRCDIFASTAFMEAISPRHLSDERLQDFLASPVHYFLKKPLAVHILPLTLDSEEAHAFWVQKFQPLLESSNCAVFLFLWHSSSDRYGKHGELHGALDKIIFSADEIFQKSAVRRENSSGTFLFYSRASGMPNNI